MPTTKEQLDIALQILMQSAAYECHCVGGECYYCDEGKRSPPPPLPGASDEDMLAWSELTGTEDCAYCKGTGKCDNCVGGVCVAGPYDAGVAAGALAGVLMLAQRAREKADFDTLNFALDWGSEYCMAMIQDEARRGATVEATMERMKKGGELIRSVTPDEPPPAGALTPEEIAELTGDEDSPKGTTRS